MVKDKKDPLEKSKEISESLQNPSVLEGGGEVKANEVFEDPKESRREATIENDQLRQAIERMELDEASKKQVPSHTKAIQSLDDEKKIKNLLQLAQKKGVVFAVHVAKKMNNPYILDVFHDMLAKEGYYKKFTK